MTRHNDKQKVRDFYDRLSPHSQDLWGMHLHHGYWINGEETKEKAQIQLVEYLVRIPGDGDQRFPNDRDRDSWMIVISVPTEGDQ